MASPATRRGSALTNSVVLLCVPMIAWSVYCSVQPPQHAVDELTPPPPVESVQTVAPAPAPANESEPPSAHLPRRVASTRPRPRSPSPQPAAKTPVFHSVEYRDRNQWHPGLELRLDRAERLVLRPDGSLLHLDAAQPPGVYRRTQDAFHPATAATLKRTLLTEYGRSYEVVSTDHFVVVQPRGRRDRWSRRFEDSHHRFLATMRSLGVPTHRGRFKMIVVVHPNPVRMGIELKARGFAVQNVAGLYAQDCNRVFTHDHGDQDDFAETLRHEAAHQSAFNTGVHSRLCSTPRWITEGLGQWLEIAPANNGRFRMRTGPNDNSMWHLDQNGCLENPAELSARVASLVRGDELFDDPATVSLAYSVAWAMTHHLANREPRRLAAVYRHTGSRPPFVGYPAAERRRDFSHLVDANVDRYAVSLWRYLRSLP